MRYRTIILTLISTSTLLAIDESPPPLKKISALGANSFGVETLDSLNTTGLVKLNHTVVNDRLSVNGSLIAQGATIGSIEVMGEANLTDTVIQNGGTILGYLQAHHVTIEKPLIINGQKAVFSSCKLNEIIVHMMEAFKGKQIIELRQKTLVDGPITFESGKGEVYLYPGSQVLGPISGGKIVKKY